VHHHITQIKQHAKKTSKQEQAYYIACLKHHKDEIACREVNKRRASHCRACLACVSLRRREAQSFEAHPTLPSSTNFIELSSGEDKKDLAQMHVSSSTFFAS
jgi:hypothetical protein